MTRSFSSNLAWIVGIAAVVGAVIKAKTCAITHDEAVTYLLYVDGPWSRIFEHYTAGNHLLFSALARLSTALFGEGELAFRLPSLCAAVVIVVVLRAILLSAAPRFAPLGMAVILWNPLVLDYLSMARGYALSLAFFLVALRIAVRPRDRTLSSGDLWTAGGALGLSIAANLTTVLPAAACGALILATASAVPKPRTSVVIAAAALILPGVAALSLNLAAMGWEIDRPEFWYGTSSLPLMMASFDQRLLFHQAPVVLVPIDEVLRGDWLSAIVTSIVSPMLWASVILGAAVAAFRRSASRVLIAAGLVIAVSIALIVAAHLVADVRFLRGRTGFVLLVTMLIGAVTLAADLVSSPRVLARAGGAALALALGLLVARSLGQLRLDRLSEGYFEAPVRDHFRALEALRPTESRSLVRVVAHAHPFGPGLEYYRSTRSADWMAPIDRVATPGVRYDAIVGESSLARSRVVGEFFREIGRDADSATVVLVAK